MMSFAKRLVQDFPSWQVLLVDLRCHGESAVSGAAPSGGPHGVESAAADVLKLVGRLKLFPEVLIGHSFGGKVVMSMVDQFGRIGRTLPKPVQVTSRHSSTHCYVQSWWTYCAHLLCSSAVLITVAACRFGCWTLCQGRCAPQPQPRSTQPTSSGCFSPSRCPSPTAPHSCSSCASGEFLLMLRIGLQPTCGQRLGPVGGWNGRSTWLVLQRCMLHTNRRICGS